MTCQVKEIKRTKDVQEQDTDKECGLTRREVKRMEKNADREDLWITIIAIY